MKIYIFETFLISCAPSILIGRRPSIKLSIPLPMI